MTLVVDASMFVAALIDSGPVGTSAASLVAVVTAIDADGNLHIALR